MFSFLTPTDKFAFIWHGFYRDQKETIPGSAWATHCLWDFQNAALAPGPFTGTWQKILKLWGYMCSWESTMNWRIGVVQTCEMERFPNLLRETLQWPLASWYLVSLGAVCTMGNLMMIQLLGEDGSVSFTATTSSPLQASALSSSGVSALGILCSSLTCKRSWFLQPKEEHAFHWRYICTWNLFRVNPQELAFCTDVFEAFPLQRNNNNNKNPQPNKKGKKTNAKFV